MNGEDIYYNNMIKKYSDFEPIQLGYFRINTKTDKDFISIIESMKIRVIHFVHKYWENIDDDLFSELTDLNLICKNVKIFNIRYHIESKSIFVLLNHAKVSGSDYLLLGSVMFNGDANSLFRENKSLTNIITNSIYKTHFVYSIFKNLFYKYPRDRYNYENIIYSSINKTNKFYIIYEILVNIMNSTSNTDKLVCLLPIGFDVKVNSGNDIGVILFTFYKNTPFDKFKKYLYGLQNLAIGSKLLLTDNNYINIYSDIETKFKKNIDVVITLGDIINNTIELDIASSGMYYKMNYDFSYPYYIWGLSMNNKTHITYSVSDKLCNIQKLCNITNGENITNKYIYKLNAKL